MSLSVAGLSVEVGGQPILHGVDLDVPDGAIVGLLGPNGSGKSTLLKTLYRVNRPTAGDVLIDGEPLLALSARDAAKRLAVVTQESSLEFDFTVDEVVATGRTPHRSGLFYDERADRAVCLDALRCVSGTHLAKRRFMSLSGGEKQRVLVARAIAQDTPHLLLDEPTNHLDIRHQVDVLELVVGLGRTVLAALHDLSLAAMFCDLVYVLADGRVAARGTPSEVITADLVRHVYGADVLVVPHPELGVPHLITRRANGANRKTTT